MIWTAKLALLTVGLLAVGGAAAATTNPTALAHMAENAKDAIRGHRDAAPECDGFRNHGEYVSSIAKATHNDSDDATDRDADDAQGHENRSDMRNMTHDERKAARENQTDDDHASDEAGEAENPIREAAQSDIGKGCQHVDDESGRQDAARAEADDEATDDDAGEPVEHGQGAEHRHEK